MTENNPALIFVSAQIMDVQMVKSLLESEGIKAFVFDDNIVRVQPFLSQAVGGVKLLVSSQDLREASEILRQHLNTTGEPPFSGTLAPINRSTLLRNVPEPLHSVELEVGSIPIRKHPSKNFSQSDWVLAQLPQPF